MCVIGCDGGEASDHFEKAFPSSQEVLLFFFDGLRLQILKNMLERTQKKKFLMTESQIQADLLSLTFGQRLFRVR